MSHRTLKWSLLATLALLFFNSAVVCQRVSLVSINGSRTATGNLPSGNQKISANGRFVVFESDADNLVPLDNNGMKDVFRYDLVTGAMRLVSETPSGTSGNGASYDPSISASGEYVVFTSEASDLLCGQPACPNDTNGKPDVFRRFLPSFPGVICVPLCTRLISVNRDGTDSAASFGSGSFSASVSADGDKIAFLSDAFDLMNGNPPAGVNVYLREPIITDPPITLVTAAVRGPFACPRNSSNPVISANGLYVAFESFANDLTMEDDPCSGTQSDKDVFLYDRVGNSLRLASRSTSGAAGNGVSEKPLVADDGTVVFESAASDLVTIDGNSLRDVFTFRSNSVNLVSVNASGTASGNGDSADASISRDGRRIAFDSNATNLVNISDTNGTADVFFRDLNSNTTTLVSINRFGTGTGGRQSTVPAISANGRFVAFESESIDLVGGPVIGFTHDIFTRDLTAGRTKRLSVNRDETGGSDFPSFASRISANGNTVAFQSNATNLVTVNDPNQQGIDIFVARQSRPTTDYDEDGISDVAVFRPSNGTWYVQRSSDNTLGAIQFGLAGDIPQPADYDGDGVTDVAVFRPSNGTWYIANSTGSFLSANVYRFGAAGDKPIAADFSGDGRAEIAVYRPLTGEWWIFNPVTGSLSVRQWGLAGDLPAPVDYFGDGRADIAVFRPSNGTWYIINSSTNSFVFRQWGLAGDKPAAGDYDGDGRADIAVFRPSTGIWYVLQSSNNQLFAIQWGLNGDAPQPADYDGDWRIDFALWRPSNMTWYIRRSSNGSFAFSSFGLSADLPVAAAYVIE